MRGRGSLQFRLPHPHRSLMTAWKTTQAPCGKKTKAELREMLAEAVRNTQSETETKPSPKAEKERA